MFKKIKYNNKVVLMKLLKNETVKKIGEGKDVLGNDVVVYRDMLNNYYYSLSLSNTEFFKTLEYYFNEEPSLYELLQIRGMVLALDILKNDEKINVKEFLKRIDKRIKKLEKLEKFDWKEKIQQEIENYQFFDFENLPLYTYDTALEAFLVRMKEKYNA